MKRSKLWVAAGSMLLGSVFAPISLASDAAPTDEVKAVMPQEKPSVEAVFVLDTTGSMGGMIEGAKQKIWAIANTLASAKPTPRIKLGLVAYRDRGDAYVTKVVSLTDDLDAVYKELMSFQAGGGGDTPESVNQGLNEAVTRMTWSEDKKSYRVIFLVGDCPPHMDYPDDVKYPETCKLAATRGITINTILCGGSAEAMPIWKEIAAKAEGQFMNVEQSGGAVVAETKYDKELAKLATDLDKTRIHYGNEKEQAEQTRKSAVAKAVTETAPSAAQAQRAELNASQAGRENWSGKNELINDVQNARVKVSELKEEELPEELRKLQKDEREKVVAEKTKQREEIQKQITELAAKRQALLEAEMKKAPKADAAFDAGVYRCVQDQAKKKGIQYEGAAKQ